MRSHSVTRQHSFGFYSGERRRVAAGHGEQECRDEGGQKILSKSVDWSGRSCGVSAVLRIFGTSKVTWSRPQPIRDVYDIDGIENKFLAHCVLVFRYERRSSKPRLPATARLARERRLALRGQRLLPDTDTSSPLYTGFDTAQHLSTLRCLYRSSHGRYTQALPALHIPGQQCPWAFSPAVEQDMLDESHR